MLQNRSNSSLTWLACLMLCTGCASGAPAPAGTVEAVPDDARAAVNELLAADRSFAATSEQADVATGPASMFAEDAVMTTPVGRFVQGRAAVVAALAALSDSAGGRLGWRPIRGGIAADGQQGFTLGYATLRRADGSTAPFKYLAYWIKSPGGWRVATYRLGQRPSTDVSLAMMAPSVPARMVRPSTDAAAIDSFRMSLDTSERAFSRDAQTMGLGPAFARYGRRDAANMGGPRRAGFIFGADSIGAGIAPGATGGSRVSWWPDRVIVASSGDLGVTIGTIRANTPDSAGVRVTFPFFTVWRRDSVGAAWRYIAE